MQPLPRNVEKALSSKPLNRPLRLGFLTGAGISAESGIPTFRGPEGYWTVGSKVYHPMELATHAAFTSQPWDVWRWYLYREAVCRQSPPNPGHNAITELAEQPLLNPVPLMTQNVDGLHRRAGFPITDLFEIHGHIAEMRCAERCSWERFALPGLDLDPEAAKTIDDATLERTLKCPLCGAKGRPHILWFDEYYEEALFRSDSALKAMDAVDLVVTVGTSAATNLPVQTVQRAVNRGAILIDINPGEESPFGQVAERTGGAWWKSPSADALGRLKNWILENAL